jgi:hypothetical protein
LSPVLSRGGGGRTIGLLLRFGARAVDRTSFAVPASAAG